MEPPAGFHSRCPVPSPRDSLSVSTMSPRPEGGFVHKDSMWWCADPVTPRGLVGISANTGTHKQAPGLRGRGVGARSQALGLPFAASAIGPGHYFPFETQFPHLHKWEKDRVQALLTNRSGPWRGSDEPQPVRTTRDVLGRHQGAGPRSALPFPSQGVGSCCPSPWNTHPCHRPAGSCRHPGSLGCHLLREAPGPSVLLSHPSSHL